MDDYYAMLGVDRAASSEEIASKIKQEMRIWPKRAANPDLSRRQEAERRVQLLGEAKATLLNPEARTAYDKKLAIAGSQRSSTVSNEDGTDWVELARRYLSSNDYNSALYAAREARNAGVTTAEVWSLLCRANAGLNKLDEALYEAKQAADLSPADPQVHIDLGSIHETREEWEPAYAAFHAAYALEPAEDGPRVAMALVRANQGRMTEAVNLMEQTFAQAQDREQVGSLLALCLVQAAEQVPRIKEGDAFYITSPQEIDQIRRMMARARQVTTDPEAIAAVVDMEKYVNKCAARTFSFGAMISDGFFRLGAFLLLVTVCVATCAGKTAILLFFISAGLIFIGVQRARPFGWKVNAMLHAAQLSRIR